MVTGNCAKIVVKYSLHMSVRFVHESQAVLYDIHVYKIFVSHIFSATTESKN